jgi:hypothetical protein
MNLFGQLVGLLGRGIIPTQGIYNTIQKNADTHPCLEWDSNPRSQCSSGRRQYVIQTTRPVNVVVLCKIVKYNIIIERLSVLKLFPFVSKL